MTKKHKPPAKPWVHLTDVEADLLAKGVASNAITAGFFGGGI